MTARVFEALDARLTADERASIEAVTAFTREQIEPRLRNGMAGGLPREIAKGWAALGMTALQTPKALGGLDASYFAKLRAAQALARCSFAAAFSLNNMQSVATRIARHGSAVHRARYLPGLLNGDCIGAFALTEPGAGSDLLALSTAARRVDGGWRLTGEKSWVTNMDLLDIALVLAQTGEGARGLTTFIVELGAPGVVRLAPHDVSAGSWVGLGGVRFDDCFVADDAVLHAPGEAFKVAMMGINGARIHVAAMCVAALEAGLRKTVDHCGQRQAFGRRLLDHQGLRWQLADVATDLEAASLLVFRGADDVAAGRDASLSAAHAKRFATRAAASGLTTCVQSMGAQGLLQSHGLMRQLGEVKLAGYADGSTEMQTDRISQLLSQHYGSSAAAHKLPEPSGHTMPFKAIYLTATEDKKTLASVQLLDDATLPEGDVTVDVEYSTLNYKDALAITGRSPVVRKFPMVPGIDFAGTVRESRNERWKAGDPVILNGFGVGETHWGGLAGRARVKGDWLTPRPSSVSAATAMGIGTAGYTAMLCVMALERRGVQPGGGPVLVTGANGGVGSIAIALLSRLGFEVVASTGRPEEAEHLKRLGAREIIDRASLSQPGKPLQKERWAAAVDSVGSHTLANVCASMRYGGTVAACGLAQGMDFPASVAPFILRGVTLVGVDSVFAPMAERVEAWRRLGEELPASVVESNTRTVSLEDAVGLAATLLDGQVRGRLLVAVQ